MLTNKYHLVQALYSVSIHTQIREAALEKHGIMGYAFFFNLLTLNSELLKKVIESQLIM